MTPKSVAGGLFITLEGGEGAGKSTQMLQLAERLRAQMCTVVTTREPGGTPAAERVRRLLLERDGMSIDPIAEAMLFAAARRDHVAALIRPVLDRDQVVLCDRFMDSTRVYQGVAGAVPEHVVDQLEAMAVGSTVPDLTVILDLDPELGNRRASTRRMAQAGGADHFEAKDLSFHQAVRRGFLALATLNPQRFVVIAADRDADEVSAQIWLAVEAVLKRKTVGG